MEYSNRNGGFAVQIPMSIISESFDSKIRFPSTKSLGLGFILIVCLALQFKT